MTAAAGASPANVHHGGMTFVERRRLFLAMLGAPALIYVCAVALWPIAQGLWISLHDYSLLRPDRQEFVGLGNYIALLSDDYARRAIVNTLVFTASAVTIEFVLGFGLALLLWRDSMFNRIATALMLVPIALTPLAVGLVFRALLAADFGLVGYYARVWGISGPRGFFGDPGTAMGAIIFIDVWQWTPLVALILLAGLRALPTDVLEAARADGATAIQRFRIIVVPMMLPSILLALVLRTMEAFKLFDSVFATTRGGPGDGATNVLGFYAVKEGLEFFNVGFASAISNLMLVLVGVLAMAFILVIRRADKRANG